MIFYDECWIFRAELFQTKAFQYNYAILSHVLKKNFIIENTYTLSISKESCSALQSAYMQMYAT